MSQYTSSGFPCPDTTIEYKYDEVVWALVNPKMPYWPAQIQTGGIIGSLRKTPTTKNLPKLPIKVIHDPDINVIILTKEDIINNNIKKKRKKSKKSNNARLIERSKVIKWDAIKQNGEEIDYPDIFQEYADRININTDNINESIYHQLNDIAIKKGEAEHKRFKEYTNLVIQRAKEREELQKIRKKEMKIKQKFENKIFDGRKYNKNTNEYFGHVLHAGDKIRYWGSINNIPGSSSSPIETVIIKCYDEYGILKLKNTVPIDVEISGNPPLWDTDIELLDVNSNKWCGVYYPLKQCKFIPSEIENELENEHRAFRNQWENEMKAKGWGGLIYGNSNSNSNDNQVNKQKRKRVHTCQNHTPCHSNKTVKKRKRSRKRKRRLSDDDDDDDIDMIDIATDTSTDLEILSNTNNDNKPLKRPKKRSKKQLIADSDDTDDDIDLVQDDKPLNTINENSVYSHSKSKSDINQNNSEQPRKKRRLNNINKQIIISSSDDDRVSQEQIIPFKHSNDINYDEKTKKFKKKFTKPKNSNSSRKLRKEQNDIDDDDIEMDIDDNNDYIRNAVAVQSVQSNPQRKSKKIQNKSSKKQQKKPTTKNKKQKRKQREIQVLSTNDYVDEYCCVAYQQTFNEQYIDHDLGCDGKGIFVSGNSNDNIYAGMSLSNDSESLSLNNNNNNNIACTPQQFFSNIDNPKKSTKNANKKKATPKSKPKSKPKRKTKPKNKKVTITKKMSKLKPGNRSKSKTSKQANNKKNKNKNNNKNQKKDNKNDSIEGPLSSKLLGDLEELEAFDDFDKFRML